MACERKGVEQVTKSRTHCCQRQATLRRTFASLNEWAGDRRHEEEVGKGRGGSACACLINEGVVDAALQGSKVFAQATAQHGAAEIVRLCVSETANKGGAGCVGM